MSSIAQELDKNKFQTVQMRISHKYDEIEQLLIEEFIRSHDRKRMREIAVILSEFKGFNFIFTLLGFGVMVRVLVFGVWGREFEPGGGLLILATFFCLFLTLLFFLINFILNLRIFSLC